MSKQRKSLRERLAEMTPEEIRVAMRRTAEHDRELERLGLLFDPDDLEETIAIAEAELPVYVACAQEITDNPEQR